MSGVKETEHHTQQPYRYHLQTAKPHQRQSHNTGSTGGQSNSTLHGVQCHPPLSTGTTGPQTRLTVVGATDKVEEVVDEIGIYLHQESKKQAKGSRCPTEYSANIGNTV